MADLTLKANDTWPPLEATLVDVNGPIDLTAATNVRLLMKANAVLVSGNATIDDAANGVVSYTWAPGDTANAGVYQAEFEITWTGGAVETVPNETYFTVEIKDDLG